MRIFVALILSVALSVSLHAQEKEMETVDENEEKRGFRKENLFTGGGIQLSFSGSTFIGGARPGLGYSINKWLDAGGGINFTYFSNRHITYYSPGTGLYYSSDDKLRQTLFGPGVFARVYPVKFLFLQAQGEMNFISQKIIYAANYPSEKTNYNVPSLLVGAGYCNGREGVGNLFYYLSLMVDVIKDRNSPYVEQISNGKVNMLPIIRAGLQIPLFQGRRNGFR